MKTTGERRISRSLILFSAALFMQVTAGLSIVGVLPSIASEWHLTSTAIALLITVFGATFAVSAPLLQMLVGHWIRRTQILAAIAILALGTLLFAAAPGYTALLAARILMGLGSALLSPVLLALGASMVKPPQQGAALAVVSMGISLATVLGIPASAWLGALVGPRLLYAIIALLLIALGVAIALLVDDRSAGERVNARKTVRLLGRPATLSGLAVIFLVTAGIFSTFTLITPILRDAYGAGASMVSVTLFVYGASGLFGNFFVRRAAMKWSSETLLRGAMIGLVVVFAALWLLPTSWMLLLPMLMAWSFLGDIIWPSQQRRMVELESEFRGLALALSSSFLFSGIAFGSALGGIVYPAHGFAGVLVLSMLLVFSGLWTLAFSVRVRRASSAAETSARFLGAAPQPGVCMARPSLAPVRITSSAADA